MFYFQLLTPDIENGFQKGKYKPQIVALAEGLVQLKIEIAANIDYYSLKKGAHHLLPCKKFDINKVKCLIVASDILFDIDAPTIQRIQECKKKKVPVVVLDWIASRFFTVNKESMLEKCDQYLFYSYVPECAKISNKIQPWPIGFTNRVTTVCQRFHVPFENRKRAILWSHRVPHNIRKTVWDNFYSIYLMNHIERFNDLFKRPVDVTEYDTLMNYQTGNRHNPEFYQVLCSLQAVDCCGGICGSKNSPIKQWDSYLLWEAFCAGCCVITLDLEYYGFKTGAVEEPKNMEHYIGLRLDQPEYLKNLATSFIKNRLDLKTIAQKGHEWATKYFNPIQRANDLTNVILKLPPQVWPNTLQLM